MAILTDRTELSAGPAVGDVLHVVDVSDTTDDVAGTSKKITVQNLLNSLPNLTELAAGAASTDEVLVSDAGVAKRISVQNVFNSVPNLTELAAGAASTDEFLVSDAGVAKRMSVQNVFNSVPNLTELAAGADSTDEILVSDAGTAKRISVQNVFNSVPNLTELAVAPASTDEVLLSDAGVAKRISVSNLLSSLLTGTINFIIDGGGSAITTGLKGWVRIDFDCTITAVEMTADQSGSIVVDIWKDTYANHPATDADTITASAVPTISAATKSQDSTLTGWTTSVTAGDYLFFNVDSASTVEKVTIALDITRSL